LRLIASLAAMLGATAAHAASLTLPSVTVTGPISTVITCNAVAAKYPPPLAAGTVVFNCSVAPTGWVGSVSLSGSQFLVANLNGVTFTVNVGPTALPTGDYQPGTLQSSP
jgi:hypothetical protein